MHTHKTASTLDTIVISTTAAAAPQGCHGPAFPGGTCHYYGSSRYVLFRLCGLTPTAQKHAWCLNFTCMCLSLAQWIDPGWKQKWSTFPGLYPCSHGLPACLLACSFHVTGLNYPGHTNFLLPRSHTTAASSLILVHTNSNPMFLY